MESGLPYPVKGAWIQGTSIIPSSFADPNRIISLFKKLEFVVVVDIFPNPAISLFADIVLPAAMYPEKDSLYVHYAQLGAINRAIAPPGQCLSDGEIILAMGKRIAPDYFPFENMHAWLDYRLLPAGMTFAELRACGSSVPDVEYFRQAKGKLRSDGEPGLSTPSGKIELNSSILRTCGLPSIPAFNDCLSGYQRTYGQEYPYILTTGGRKSHFFCAEHRNIKSLRKRQPYPLVTIHPETAHQAGINDGDWVRIYSPFGECRMKADIDDRYSPEVIHCDSGWWYPEKRGAQPEVYNVRSSNVNELFPSGLEGPSGFGYPFRGFICNIEKE
jgi:anaerobic selenocysteine-containing dehydrogenase